jgi:hypothetical protein
MNLLLQKKQLKSLLSLKKLSKHYLICLKLQGMKMPCNFFYIGTLK